MPRSTLLSPRFWSNLLRGSQNSLRSKKQQTKNPVQNRPLSLETLEARLVPDADPLAILFARNDSSHLANLGSPFQGISLAEPAVNSPSPGVAPTTISSSFGMAANLATTSASPGASSLSQTAIGSTIPAAVTSANPSSSTQSYQVNPSVPQAGSPPSNLTAPLGSTTTIPTPTGGGSTSTLTSPVNPTTGLNSNLATPASVPAPGGGSPNGPGSFSPLGGPSTGSGGGSGSTGSGTGNSGSNPGPILTVTGGGYERHYTHHGYNNQSEFYLDVTIVGSFTKGASGLTETGTVLYSTWRKDQGKFTFQDLSHSSSFSNPVTVDTSGHHFFGLEDEDGPNGFDWNSFQYSTTTWDHVDWDETINYQSTGTVQNADGVSYPFATRTELADWDHAAITLTPTSPFSQAGTGVTQANFGGTWFTDWTVSNQSANFPNYLAQPASDPRDIHFDPNAVLTANTQFFARSWDSGTFSGNTNKTLVYDAAKVVQSSAATITSSYDSKNGHRYFDAGTKTITLTPPAGSGTGGGSPGTGTVGTGSTPGGAGGNSLTGQDTLTWLIDFVGNGTASGNQTSQLTSVHTNSPIGTVQENFHYADTTTKAKMEMVDVYQITDGTTKVTGTLSAKSNLLSPSLATTDGKGSYQFDAAHPAISTSGTRPASGTLNFQSKEGGTYQVLVSDQFTFQSTLKDDHSVGIGSATGSYSLTSTDIVQANSQTTGIGNAGTGAVSLYDTGNYTGSGSSATNVSLHVAMNDGSLVYDAGWSASDTGSYSGSSLFDGSFGGDGQPVLATADLQDNTTNTTTAFSSWENGSLSVVSDDGFTTVQESFATKMVNITPLVDTSSQTCHLVFDASATGSAGTGGTTPPGSPTTGNPDGNTSASGSSSGDNGLRPTSGSMQFRYENTGTIQVQSSFTLQFTAPITEKSGTSSGGTGSSSGGSGGSSPGTGSSPTEGGSGSTPGGSTGGSGGGVTETKVGLTTGSVVASSTDTILSTGVTTGSLNPVSGAGAIQDVSQYSGTGSSTETVSLHATWDDGSLAYNTGSASTDQAVFSGNSTLVGNFNAQGDPVLLTLDGHDESVTTTSQYTAYENGLYHTSGDAGASNFSESFSTKIANTTPLLDKSSETYHLVFDASAAANGSSGNSPNVTPPATGNADGAGGSGNSSSNDSGPELTAGSFDFRYESTGTLQVQSNLAISFTSILKDNPGNQSNQTGGTGSGGTVTPPNSGPSPSGGGGNTGSTNGAGTGAKIGTANGSVNAQSTDTITSSSVTSGTWDLVADKGTLHDTAQYGGTGNSTIGTALQAKHDDGSLTYNTGSSTTSGRVYSGNSALNGSFDKDGNPVQATLDSHDEILATTTAFSATENGKIQTTQDGGATQVTELFSIAIVNTSSLVAKAEETSHFVYDASVTLATPPGSGGSPGAGNPGPSPNPGNPGNPDGSGNSGGSNPSGGGDHAPKPIVATLSFRYETSGGTKLDQSASGTFHSKLNSETGTGNSSASGTFSIAASTDFESGEILSGNWDLLANEGTIHDSAHFEAGEAVTAANSYHFEQADGGIIYDANSSSKTDSEYSGQSKIDGFLDSKGKQTSGTSYSHIAGSSEIEELTASERYESKNNPIWQKSQTGEGTSDYQATLDLTFASNGTASGTSVGVAHSTLHLHDVSSWVGVQRIFDTNSSAGSGSGVPDSKGYLPGQIGTLTVNDRGDDDMTLVGNSAWNLNYQADQPHGDSSSTVQVSGTTSWTTDHTQVLNQGGHIYYKTDGQDKSALTGSDAILFHYNADQITGERSMTVANNETHDLTINGTGTGIGVDGWSGDWKYHYQSQDLVDDTDTKEFTWTNAAWSESSHTFRTDHKGSEFWTFSQGDSYNQEFNPELGQWRTEIRNLSMGGSSSYHEVKWGGPNNYQFTDNRGGSSFKNSNGSGGYGFSLSGSSGSSANSSAETASYHDNRSGATVNGVTTYSSVDIHSLAEKTTWSESKNNVLQVSSSYRNDDWSRDEITITGNSSTLTTTKNNAYTKGYAYTQSNGSGTPGTGGYNLGDNKSSTGTTSGMANGPILGGNYNNSQPGTPSSLPQTSGYFGESIVVNGRQTPGGFWGGNPVTGENGSKDKFNWDKLRGINNNSCINYKNPDISKSLDNLKQNDKINWEEVEKLFEKPKDSGETGIVDGHLIPNPLNPDRDTDSIGSGGDYGIDLDGICENILSIQVEIVLNEFHLENIKKIAKENEVIIGDSIDGFTILTEEEHKKLKIKRLLENCERQLKEFEEKYPYLPGPVWDPPSTGEQLLGLYNFLYDYIENNPIETAIFVGDFALCVFCEPYDWYCTSMEIYKNPTNPWVYMGLIGYLPGISGGLLSKWGQKFDKVGDGAKIIANNSSAKGSLKRNDNILAENLGGRINDHSPHHLIGIAEAEKFDVMRRAEELGYDINRGSNGINLPNKLDLAKELNLPYHPKRGRHRVDMYTGPVDERLRKLQQRYDDGLVTDSNLLDEIRKIEESIHDDLISGTLRLNNRYPWFPHQ